MDFDGLGLCFSFDRWCCLSAEFYSLTSASIMESAMIRSRGLLRSVAVTMIIDLKIGELDIVIN